MIYIWAAIFFISSIVVPVFAGEPLKVDVYIDDVSTLYFTDARYIEFLNERYKMHCAYNEPFVKVRYYETVNNIPVIRASVGGQKDVQGSNMQIFINPMTLIPFKYFLSDGSNWQDSKNFKQAGDMIFSFSPLIYNQLKAVNMHLDAQFKNDLSPQNLLENFKKYPRCVVGGLSSMSVKQLKEGLLEKGIINKTGPDYLWTLDDCGMAHGIYSCYPSEIKVKSEEVKSEKIKATLFYSHLKKICYGSIAMIIMYALYKKFYVGSNLYS